MALSGSFYKYPVKPSYGSFGLYCEWSGVQNISGNYTDVTLTVYIRYYNLSVGEKTNSTVSINGVSETYTSPAINNYPAKDVYHWIKTYTVKVPHNSDGTKTCTLSASWPFNGTYAGTSVGTITASTTVTLDPIARLSEPTVSASSVKMGNTVTIKTNRKSTALKHVLKYTFGTQTTETQIATSVGDSYTWTVPDLAAKCNNALSGTCTIYCHTYSGSTYLGTKTTNFKLTVPDATTPTVSATTVKMGGSVTLGVSGRKSTNFKHVFTYSFGAHQDVVIDDGVTSSCTWNVHDLAAEIDGATSGTCTIKCHTYNGTKYVGTVSKTITLQVPDASVPTLSASTVAMGSTLTIYTNSKSSNFTHNIAYSFNGATDTIVSGIYTLKNWGVPIDLAATIPSATKGTGTITCTTYNGTDRTDKNKVGTKTVTFTATVPDNSTTKPSISGLTLTPSHLDEYPNLKQYFSDIYVQGLTKVKAAYTASAPYSSVKSVTMTVKNSSGKSLSSVSGNSSSATSGAINAVDNVTVTLTVTNARGQTNSSTKTISFYEYSKPELLTDGTKGADSLLRCDENGNILKTGLHLRIHAGRKKWSLLNGKNYCDLKYRWKVYDGTPFSDDFTKQENNWIVLLNSSSEGDVFDGVATVDGNPSSEQIYLYADKTYLVEIQVNDTVGSQVKFAKTILSCEVAFLLKNDGKGASFGMYSKEDGLEVAWRSRFYGDVQGKVLGFGGLIRLAQGTNVDDVTAHGSYSIYSNDDAKTMENLPIPEAGTLRVYSSNGASAESGTWIYTVQEYIHYQGAIRYMRHLHTEDDPGDWNADDAKWKSLSAYEEGESDDWTYRKWSDGTAECWAKRNVTVDITTAWGTGLYYGNVGEFDFPFTFAEAPVCQVTCERGSSSQTVFLASAGQATTARAPAVIICRGPSAEGVNVNVLYSVHGRWK